MADLQTVKIRDLIETQSVMTTDYLVLEKDTGTFKCQARYLKGATGLTPNVQVGNTTTLAPGQLATVNQRGNTENPVFDFGIPQGIQGPIGPIGPKGDTPSIEPLQTEIDNRFNDLTSQQQGDSEVIDARGSYPALKARLDAINDDLIKCNDQTIVTHTTENNFSSIYATKNGYLDNVLLEGKTLVNIKMDYSKLNSAYYSYNDSSKTLTNISNSDNQSWSNINPVIDNLELGSTYTFLFLAPKTNTKIQYQTIDTDIKTIQTTNDNSYIIRTFISDSNRLKLKMFDSNLSESKTIKNIMILKGDYTQNTPGYFEGIKSVGDDVTEIKLNSLKGDGNLVDINKSVKGKYWSSTNTQTNEPTSLLYENYINVVTGMKIWFNSTNQITVQVCEYDSNKNFIQRVNVTVGNLYTTQNNVKFIRVSWYQCGLDYKTMCNIGTSLKPYVDYKSDTKKVLYKDTDGTWKKPTLRQWDSIEKHSDGKYYYHKRSESRSYQSGDETNSNVITDKTNTVYKLDIEIVFECTPIDLISYDSQTNYSIECGPIYPKTTLKVNSYLGNVVSILKDKVSYLENMLVDGLKLVIAGNMQELAYRLYPQDFVSNVDDSVDMEVIK